MKSILSVSTLALAATLGLGREFSAAAEYLDLLRVHASQRTNGVSNLLALLLVMDIASNLF